MPARHLGWLVIAVAVVARVAAVVGLQTHLIPRSTYEHGEIAANMLSGRGFAVKFLGADGPTSQQAPLYPAIVAGFYSIGGVESPRSLLLLELSQAVLGGLLVAGVMGLTREVTPGRPGLEIVAGLIAALHPTLVYAATHVQVVSLAATLLTWTLVLAYRASRTGLIRDAVACGVTLGVLTLTDPILALAGPCLGWILVLGQGWRMAMRSFALVLIGGAIVVTPWIVRNARVHGEFVFIKSSFGYAFWQGNCALSEGTDKVVRPSVETALNASGQGLQGLNESLWKARHAAGYLDDIALTKADYAMLSKLSEPARSRLLFHRALDDLRADPWRYSRLCLRRFRYFVLFDETNPKTRTLAYRVPHLALTLASLFGLIVMPSAMRRMIWPMVLTVALVAAFHSLTIVSARFHIPIEPLMAIAAAAGVMSLLVRRHPEGGGSAGFRSHVGTVVLSPAARVAEAMTEAL